MAGGQSGRLRLLAEDAEDLEVIAAALQDAVGKIGDIRYEAPARQLTLVFNRFRWESDGRAAERVRAGLQFGGVLGVQARKLRREAPEAVIELLTIEFEPGEAPGGVVVLSFAGGGDLRLEVECVDVALADVSEPWPVRRKPAHEG
jgi:hypothetical protein